MNIKMTNSQLSTANPRKQKQTKQTTRTGTESQVWGSFGGYQLEGGRVRKGEMVQGSRSIIGRNKTERGMLRIV